MMLVARLGLRSIEVARLELRDVDWRAGELVVRGKGAARTGFRCRPRSVRPWSPTCPAAATGTTPAICS